MKVLLVEPVLVLAEVLEEEDEDVVEEVLATSVVVVTDEVVVVEELVLLLVETVEMFAYNYSTRRGNIYLRQVMVKSQKVPK